MGYDGTLKFNTEILEKGFSAGVKKLGGVAKTGLTVVGGAVAGVATAFGVMTKKALDSYASLEQNIGGVETLFKDSSQSVVDNAKKAYKTAGLSANAYMETVTSFSASLLQSLGGDTKKAADYADRAIIDMSDNANKMGTSMGLIQNAYQGFAKQNYTMLDNLKLGYGGTKEEMQRLVQDASKMTDVQKELGVSVDGSSLSFGNIVNAISVMQKHMGIAGTTSKEASETISGSISSMKGAFDNFLNGTGSPKELAETMVTAGKNVIKGLSEIVPRLLETLPEVKQLVQDNIVQAFSEDNVKQMVESGKNIIMSLISGMTDSFPSILPVALNLIQFTADAIVSNIPILVQKGYELLDNVISGFVSAIPTALPKVLDFIQGIGGKIAEAAPILIQKGFDLLGKLVEGIVQAIPILIAKVPTIISTFANVINDNFPTILAKGFELLWELIKGIISAIPDLIANAPKIVSAIVDVIMAFNWLSLGKNIITFFKNGISSMIGAVKNAGKSVYDAVKNAIVNLPSTLSNIGKTAISGFGNAIRSMIGTAKNAAIAVGNAVLSAIKSIPGKVVSIGKDIVTGLWNGISSMVGWITDKVMGFANSVLGGIKKALGIHSPSRVMRDEVGKMMALGMGIGFEKNIPDADMQKGLETTIGKLQAEADNIFRKGSAPTASQIVKSVTNNYTGETTNYEKVESAMLRALNKANKKPITLNNRELRRGLRDGGIVLA
jgi:phage-related protein|nr:MAG TPA: tail tape measure protein [Caudoviricetes sp.]